MRRVAKAMEPVHCRTRKNIRLASGAVGMKTSEVVLPVPETGEPGKGAHAAVRSLLPST